MALNDSSEVGGRARTCVSRLNFKSGCFTIEEVAMSLLVF